MQNQQIAESLAKELIALGHCADSPCHRIEFKVGRYPDKERPAGGMNQDALVRFFTEVLNDELQAHPAEKYHEDFGPVLWWHLPVCEPPHVGSPTDDSWPEDGDEYFTYWSLIPLPSFPVGKSDGR